MRWHESMWYLNTLQNNVRSTYLTGLKDGLPQVDVLQDARPCTFQPPPDLSDLVGAYTPDVTYVADMYCADEVAKRHETRRSFGERQARMRKVSSKLSPKAHEHSPGQTEFMEKLENTGAEMRNGRVSLRARSPNREVQDNISHDLRHQTRPSMHSMKYATESSNEKTIQSDTT